MLTIIKAPHGGGKTTVITGLLENKINKKPFFIVPEQNHFESEYRLYKELGAENIAQVNVTSFSKLSKEILDKYDELKPYADEAVKEIIMQKILRRITLKHYKCKSISKLSTRMLGLISEFQEEGITPEKLSTAAKEIGEDKLGGRLEEISEIFKLYNEELVSGGFSDKADDISNAASLSLFHGFFSGKHIYIDGFDGFSGSQMMMMNVMMSDGELSITVPHEKTNRYVYTEKLIMRLVSAAKKAGVEYKEMRLPNPEREAKEIKLTIAPDVYTECDYVAASVHKLATKEKYNFSDIAVLSPDPSAVPGLLSAMNKYDISVFADIPEPIIEKPLVRFILTVLDAAAFEPEAIMAYIKSGFVRVWLEDNKTENKPKKSNKSRRLKRYEIDLLEKGQFFWNLKKHNWINPFPENNKALSIIEPLRNDIAGNLNKLAKRIKNADGGDITVAITDFLINTIELPATINSLINKRTGKFEKGFEVDPVLNDEYRQLWDTIIEIFESMYAALKNENISLNDYKEILRSVFSKTKTARPPQVIDAVTVGDTERTHVGGIKVLFVVGANRGCFPKSVKSGGEFNSDEIDRLFDVGLEFSDNRKGRYYKERYIVWKTLAVPTEKLYISAPLSNSALVKLEPSAVFAELEKTKGIKINNTQELPVSYFAGTKKAVRALYSAASDTDKLKITGEVLNKAGDSKYVDSIENLRKQRFDTYAYMYKISPQNAEGLMKTNKLSPSAVTAMNSCRFKYFIERGLKIRETDEKNSSELTASQFGNMVHHCLEGLLKDYSNDFDTFLSLKQEPLSDIIRRKAEAYIEDEIMQGLPQSKRKQAIFKTYFPHIEKTALKIQRDMQISKFRPVELEKTLGFDLKINGEKIRIEGIADRIDKLCVKNSEGVKEYINVLDYKTGHQTFDFSELYYGIGWQVLLYMYSITEQNASYIPSAALYCSLGTDKLSEEIEYPPNKDIKPSEKEKTSNSLQERKISGVQYAFPNTEEAALDLERLKEHYKLITDSNASFITTASIDVKDNKDLKEHFRKLTQTAINELLSGCVSAVPLAVKSKGGTIIPCTYCDYKSICINKGLKKITLTDKKQIETVIPPKKKSTKKR